MSKKPKETEKFVVPEILALPETYIQFLDAINDMVLVKGAGSKILWANKAFADFYGMTNDQLREMIDAPFSEPDHTQKFIRDDLQVFTTGKTLHIPEEPVNRHDGKIFWFETVKSPIKNKHGNIVMTVGVSRDITEKRIQDQLLIQQQQKILVDSAKMITLGEMAGGIAHEVNNPMTIIQLIMKTLTRLGADEVIDREKMLKQILRVEAAIARINKIIASVTGFSRQDGKDGAAVVNVNDIWKEAFSFCEFSLKGKDIPVTLEQQDEALVDVFPSEISQVFINLINNAADAVEGQEERWLRFSTVVAGEMVEMRLIDSGPGVLEAIRENLFKVSFTTKPVGRGTGLGLLISRKIIEKHGGKIYVDYGVKNTCFVICLPIFKSVALPAAEQKSAA